MLLFFNNALIIIIVNTLLTEMATACAALPSGRALRWQIISLTANSMGTSLHHCTGVQGPHLNTFLSFFFFFKEALFSLL